MLEMKIKENKHKHVSVSVIVWKHLSLVRTYCLHSTCLEKLKKSDESGGAEDWGGCSGYTYSCGGEGEGLGPHSYRKTSVCVCGK